MIRIFVSYRRSDSKSFAHRLYDRLRRVFGRSVFMDVSDIDPGADFPKVIDARLASCRVLLVVIGNTWLSCTDGKGARRLEAPDDYVRLEVAKGLAAADMLVIPVLVNGAPMPAAADLPSELASLADRNAIAIDDDRFDTDVVKLVGAVETRVPRRSRLPLLAAAASLALILAGVGYWIHQKLDPGYGARLVPGIPLFARLPELTGGAGMRYALRVEVDGQSVTLPDLTRGIVYTGAERMDLEKLQARQDDSALQSELMQRYGGVDRVDTVVAQLQQSVLFLPVSGGKSGAAMRVQVDKSPEAPALPAPWFECQFVLGPRAQTFFLEPTSEDCQLIHP